jgi:glycine/serine hydroxymethyltransferase
MSLQSTILDTSLTTVYTSSGTSAVAALYFCNVSPGAMTFNVHAVKSGNLADNSNIIYYAVQISATDTYVVDTEKLMLDNGDYIAASASLPDSIVATISYIGF